MTFFDTLTRFAAWTDADLRRPWSHAGRESDRRYALYRTLEQEQEAAAAALGRPASEATRIISLAQAAFGELRGLLARASEDLLDSAPAEGEWSLRRTLLHILGGELTYRTQTRYAVERTASEPVLFPPERRPHVAPEEVAGSLASIILRLEHERAMTDAYVATLDDAALGRESSWATSTVDVRFRLHRIAAHHAEHMVQCETTLERLGHAPGDAPRAVRAISRMRGLHERATDPAVLAAMDATLATRATLA